MSTKKGSLRVWWIPQVPMEAFNVEVASVTEAKLLLDTLANYDIFQFENRVKPDYSNAGGLQVFDGDEWVDWTPDDTPAFAKASGGMKDGIDDYTLEEVRAIEAIA